MNPSDWDRFHIPHVKSKKKKGKKGTKSHDRKKQAKGDADS